MSVPKVLHVAVLMNGYPSPYSSSATDSFASAIRAASPAAQIDFYDPIEKQVYPDQARYDLLVLSGGTEDPSGDRSWVRKMQAFLRRTVASQPALKIVGVCWGHQTLCVAFGGTVGAMLKAEVRHL
jgi:GMP synthase-like glutamine amidotransferase